MELELRANLNNEDDDGLNWGLVRDAADPTRVRPGAVLRAGSRRFWSWVRVVRVDDDGQVHFVQISAREARTTRDAADARRERS